MASIDHQQHARVEHAVVAAGDAIDDVATQAAARKEGADGGGGDDLEQGDAKAAHDDRRGERQLDAR